MPWVRPSIPPFAGAIRPARGHIVNEVFAGIALAALCLPLNIGYAEAAGLPAEMGIYATLAPLLVYAVLAGSRHLAIGPDATISALLAAAFGPIVVAGGGDPVALAMAAAVIAGTLLLTFWLFGLGNVVRFLSKSVLIGFIAGLALEVLLSQVRKIMAVEIDAEGWFLELWQLARSIPDASWSSIAVGVGTIASLRMMRRWAPRLPAALVTLVAVTIIVEVIDPVGVGSLGGVPSGLPGLAWPSLSASSWLDVLPAASAIAVLTVAEGLLMARRSARSHEEPFDANGELFALGAANVAGALTGSMPSGASASRTAAMEASGTRSQVPAVTAAAVVAIVVLWFTDLVERLPTPALAGLVANAVVGTIEFHELRRLWSIRRVEFGIAVGCLLGVLLLGPMAAVAVAALASAIDMMRRAADAPWARLGPGPGDDRISRFTAEDGSAGPVGLSIVRPGGPLFFANADALLAVFEQAARDPDTVWLVLDMEKVSDLDPTAADAMSDGIDLLRAAGRDVVVTRVSGSLRRLLDRYGLVGALGEDCFQPSNRAAAAAFDERRPDADC